MNVTCHVHATPTFVDPPRLQYTPPSIVIMSTNHTHTPRHQRVTMPSATTIIIDANVPTTSRHHATIPYYLPSYSNQPTTD